MELQTDLFGSPIKTKANAPSGFRYWPRALSHATETDLVPRLSELPFVPYEFQGYVGNRRIVSFGYRWNQTTRVIDPAEPLPDFLLEIRDQVAASAGLPAEAFVQALVNEYTPGAGIGWHRDRLAWDLILGVSLLAPCTLRLRRKLGSGWDRASVHLQSVFAYLLSGAVRQDWEHSITPMDMLRYSITFRTLARPRGAAYL